MRPNRIDFFAAVAALAAVVVGCQRGPVRPATAPVAGRVVTKDGSPCDGALVVFHPSAPGRGTDAKPVGKTADDGAFSLTTYEAGDGAVPGSYGVTVVWPGKPKEAKMSLSGEGGGGSVDRLAGRYGDPASPKITADVPKEGLPDLVVEVE